MRVSAVQYKAVKGDPVRSRAELAALTARAAEVSDLVVLPEMSVSGYIFAGPAEVLPFAEPARGPTWLQLSPIARHRRCWIVAGFAEHDHGALYNSALVIDPDGALAHVYRKSLLYCEDERWATPGDGAYRRFETSTGAFGVGICMDLNDDRFVQWAASARLDVIAFPTNWVEEDVPVWPYWAWRIASTGAVLVAANTWGEEDLDGQVTTFAGRSAILRPGWMYAAAPERGDGVITATVGWRSLPPLADR